MTEEKPPSLVRELASTLWFPIFFVVGFMVCYLLPFHAPMPHDVPLATVGEQSANQLGAMLDKAMPGAADITAVPDAQAARDAVLQRDAVAAYDPSSGELFYGKANGAALMQVLQPLFGPLAAAGGHQLSMVDLAPTAAGDLMGTGLFYCLLAMNIPPYVTVMMLLRSTLTTRQKLFAVMGVGAFATVFCYVVALALEVVPNDPLMMGIGFLLTQAVGWTAFGLAPIVKQFIPGVAMTLFVLLSMPSSGGAIPKEMVPPFFQALHPFLPLGQTVDALRGLLYFDGNRVLPGVLGLLCWWALGAGLVVFNRWREKRRESDDPAAEVTGGGYEHEDDGDVPVDPLFEPPRPSSHRSLSGHVLGTDGEPVPEAVVTVTDGTGVQLARALTSGAGQYELGHLPDQPVTVVASGPGRKPAVDHLASRAGRITGYDFVLDVAANRPSAASAPRG